MPLCNFCFSQTEFVTVSVDFLGTTPSLVLSPPPGATVAPRCHLVCLDTLEPCPGKFRAGEDVPFLIFLWLSVNAPRTEAGDWLTAAHRVQLIPWALRCLPRGGPEEGTATETQAPGQGPADQVQLQAPGQAAGEGRGVRAGRPRGQPLLSLGLSFPSVNETTLSR